MNCSLWAVDLDKLTKDERSERMGRVKSANTKPEMTVRRMVHGLGYRYRLHRRDLPGKPDLVFGPRRKVIFVHGCFWHRHSASNCKLARLPKSRRDFWLPKLEANRLRDIQNRDLLIKAGWSVLEIWECEIPDKENLTKRIEGFLQ